MDLVIQTTALLINLVVVIMIGGIVLSVTEKIIEFLTKKD